MGAAGIINRRGPGDSTAFDQVVGDASSEVREIAMAVRRLVYEVLPETIEVVWPRQRSVGWGTGPKKFSEQFAYLMPCRRHVTLGFYHGGGLEDPVGLLRSGGVQVSGRLSMRSLKFSSPDEVRRPELRALVAASTCHIVPPPRQS